MYATTIASKLLGQLNSFLGRISPHFRKPVARFIGDMMYGIMSQKDVKLSSIVRAREASTQSINFPPSASGVFVRIAAPPAYATSTGLAGNRQFYTKHPKILD